MQFYSSPRTLAHFRRCALLHQAWAGYRRQLVREAADTGLPVARHLFLHYPADPKVRPARLPATLLVDRFVAAFVEQHSNRCSDCTVAPYADYMFTVASLIHPENSSSFVKEFDSAINTFHVLECMPPVKICLSASFDIQAFNVLTR